MARSTPLVCALLLAASSHAALAADVADTASSDAVAVDENDIVVTAQKIEQRAIDVPITISAVSGERMAQLGVSDLDELSFYTPGLNIQEQSANNPGIVIRGITSDSGSAQQAARVTLYYNGVDISRSRGSYQGIFDVERIEVVKGPQATLFGTASAVGAISIISAKPKPGFSGELNGAYGNYNQTQLGGFINAGSDKLAARIAFAWKKRDGYVKNFDPVQDDLNGQDQLGIRGSLRFTPNDRLTIDLIGTYDRQRNPGTAFINKRLPPASVLGTVFDGAWLAGSPYSQTALGAAKLGLHRDVYDANLTATWELSDNWAVTTVNGYRDFNSLEIFDADGSRAWYLEFGEDAKGWQFSHETRFNYTGEHFRGSFGWNGFTEHGRQGVPFSTEEGTFLQCTLNVIPTLGCIAADGTVTATQATALLTRGAATVLPYQATFTNYGDNQSYSVFADGTWIPVSRLEVTAGVRALIEKRRSGFYAKSPNSVLTGAGLLPLGADTGGKTFWTEDSFKAFLPRFNVLYHFSNKINGFVTISKGRRSPTVQMGSAASPSGPVPLITPIPSENVWNYEVGMKASVGVLSGSLGVYYQKYDNFQVNVIRADGTNVTESAGSASNLGFEAEAQVKLASWLNLFGNVGYIDGGIDNKASNGRYAGDRFRLQPKVQASGGILFDLPVSDNLRIFATPSVTYRSRIFFEVPNSDAISQDAVTLVNVRAGVSIRDRYEIAAFARNLTNKNYLLDAGNTGGAFGYPTYIPAEPRLYGVQLTARF